MPLEVRKARLDKGFYLKFKILRTNSRICPNHIYGFPNLERALQLISSNELDSACGVGLLFI